MAPHPIDTILQVKSLSFSYGEKKILDDISFSVPRGDFLSIIGPNGSGKTTLLRLLCATTSPNTGTILLNAKPIQKIPLKKRALLLAVIHQKESLSFPFTATEIITMGLHPHLSRFEPLSSAHKEQIFHAMEQTDTLRFADTPVTQLSGGEMQRVMFARALVQKPQILFLDEAMSDFDIHARIQFHKMLKKLSTETGLTVISVHHDINAAYQFSDKVLALKNGRIYGYGAPSDVMTSEFFQNVFYVKAELFPKKGFFIYDNTKTKTNI